MMISAALSIASLGAKAASGIANAIRMNKERKSVRREMQGLDDWYNSEYNQDYLNTEQAQSVLAKLRENLKKNQDINTNTAAITGGSVESQIAGNQASNEVLSGAMTDMYGQATQRKDNLTQSYQSQKRGLQQRLSELRAKQIQGSANAGANAMDALGSVSSMVKGGGDQSVGQLFGFLRKPKNPVQGVSGMVNGDTAESRGWVPNELMPD